MNQCLFCAGSGPFTTTEHIIPESLGNDDLTLEGEVCDGCQRYIGKEIEKYVLEKTPIGVWRTMLGIRSKKGELPRVDLSLREQRKGILPEWSPYHDQAVAFTAHEDRSTSVDIDDPSVVQTILNGEKANFQFVLSPRHLIQMGRFFGKIALELLCTKDPTAARSARYDELRSYVRKGIRRDIWPVFYSRVGDLSDVSRTGKDDAGYFEEVVCFEYSLVTIGDYDLFSFRVGVDQWTVCMNDPYPMPTIQGAFPETPLQLVWYSLDEWRR
jgi:hypothetical protein